MMIALGICESWHNPTEMAPSHAVSSVVAGKTSSVVKARSPKVVASASAVVSSPAGAVEVVGISDVLVVGSTVVLVVEEEVEKGTIVAVVVASRAKSTMKITREKGEERGYGRKRIQG